MEYVLFFTHTPYNKPMRKFKVSFSYNGIMIPQKCELFISYLQTEKNAPPKQSVNRTSLLNCSEHFLRNRLFAFQLFLLPSCILNLLHSFQFIRCILKSKVRVGVEGYSNFGVSHKVLQGLGIHA